MSHAARRRYCLLKSSIYEGGFLRTNSLIGFESDPKRVSPFHMFPRVDNPIQFTVSSSLPFASVICASDDNHRRKYFLPYLNVRAHSGPPVPSVIILIDVLDILQCPPPSRHLPAGWLSRSNGLEAPAAPLSVLTTQRSKEFRRVGWTSFWAFLMPGPRLAISVSAVLNPHFLCPAPRL